MTGKTKKHPQLISEISVHTETCDS